MAAIELRGLTKRYEDGTGIDSLTFSVQEGEVFGLIGPRRSGKTTTIRTVLGIQSPTAGQATVLGFDPHNDLRRHKADIGYLPASPRFDESATGAEILDSRGQIKGDDRREELVARFDPPVDRRVRNSSPDELRRLALVGAFMHDPALVIMDEPMVGRGVGGPSFDRHRFTRFIHEERRRGVTVFLASRAVDEVWRLCDRVAVLRDGRLLGTEPVESLRHRCGKVVHLRIATAVTASSFEFDGVHDLDVQTVSFAADSRAGGREPEEKTTSRSSVVTDVSFTFTGDINTLMETLSSYPLLQFDLDEMPLETVFRRLSDATAE